MFFSSNPLNFKFAHSEENLCVPSCVSLRLKRCFGAHFECHRVEAGQFKLTLKLNKTLNLPIFGWLIEAKRVLIWQRSLAD